MHFSIIPFEKNGRKVAAMHVFNNSVLVSNFVFRFRILSLVFWFRIFCFVFRFRIFGFAFSVSHCHLRNSTFQFRNSGFAFVSVTRRAIILVAIALVAGKAMCVFAPRAIVFEGVAIPPGDFVGGWEDDGTSKRKSGSLASANGRRDVVSVGDLDCEGMPTSLMWFQNIFAHFV